MNNFRFSSLLLVPMVLVVAGCNFPQVTEPSPTASPATQASPMAEGSTETLQPNSVLSAYSEGRFNELQGNEKFALFFSAPWCPKCVATKQAISETPEQFAGVTLLDVDYDTAVELKQQYGITLQHSFVFFDENGEVVATNKMPPDSEVIAFFQEGTIPTSN